MFPYCYFYEKISSVVEDDYDRSKMMMMIIMNYFSLCAPRNGEIFLDRSNGQINDENESIAARRIAFDR